MIISLIIVITCFITLAVEAFYIYLHFKNSDSVLCTVISSKKKEIRDNGYLIKEYWLTEVEFKLDNKIQEKHLHTSTCCVRGQKFKCFYNRENDIIFRKRDFKKYLSNLSPVILSIGCLFLIVEFIFAFINSDIAFKINFVKTFSSVLAAAFAILGVGSIINWTIQKRQISKHSIEYLECEIFDIIRKTSYHKENKRHTYYPIYKYVYNGSEHIVKSKIGRDIAPKKGDIITVPVSSKKGGPVEYKDLGRSFILGVMFLTMSLLIFVTVVIQK